ncbi:helix-turn-helix transcriptional regulator [Burkholderia sp. Ac-20345]|uniref:helix-turn-helix transcriptional regulator n=1 Tax=Burkholderia sp. Ac-20345 TaxID=2703891 RepID=UPI00197B801F|nr:helix-turn-helix transcriptional regulator [Burkholderia sp. Ac-20345]MBN3777768.1 helix-turn-helix transcriptional regulator [Burkholderia sp. Ac-20345]
MQRDQLIGDLYEAALQPDGFLEVFHRVSESLGANVFHMFSWDAARNAPQFSIYSPRVEFDEIIARYERYYGALDPRRGFVENAPLGEFVCCQDHLTERDVERSEFFQDYQIPAGFRYLMGIRFARPGSDNILLGLLRAHGRTPYSSEERAALTGMAGHLQRSINLWRDASVLHRDATLGAELMEELGLSVFALDRHSRVVFVNRAAESMLRATTCLKLENGHLSATSAPQNDALKAALTRVAKTRKSESLALSGTSVAAHEIFLSIAVLSGQALQATFGDATMLVTVRRRSATPLVVAQQLRQSFGLSSAEAAVAEALISGKTPDECAASAGVSLATVRTQLRAIYEKTHSRNQAEAVGRMLWVLPQHKRKD